MQLKGQHYETFDFHIMLQTGKLKGQYNKHLLFLYCGKHAIKGTALGNICFSYDVINKQVTGTALRNNYYRCRC